MAKKKMNLHGLAVEICKREKGKKEVNIAQVKEILKVICEIDAEMPIDASDAPIELIMAKSNRIRKKLNKGKK